MPKVCCVKDCGAKYGLERTSFHQIPSANTSRDRLRRKLWMNAVKRNRASIGKLFVCGQHFETGKPAAPNAIDQPNWIPTLQLGPTDEDDMITYDSDPSEPDDFKIEEYIEDELQHPATEMASEQQTDFQIHSDEAHFVSDSDCDECYLFDIDDIIIEETYSSDLDFEEDSLQSGFYSYPNENRGNYADTYHGSCYSPDNNIIEEQMCLQETIEYSEVEGHDITEKDSSDLMNQNNRNSLNLEETNENQQNVEEEWRSEDLDNIRTAEDMDNFIISPEAPPFRGSEHYEMLLKEKDREIQSLKEIIAKQNKLLSCFKYDLKSFENNDSKVKHLTGLPTHSTLATIYKFLQNGILTFSTVLNKQQTFVMVLMYLRLGLCFKTLAHLFQVCTSTICKYFYTALYSMYKQLKGLVRWPTKEMLKTNTPDRYKHVFEKPITVILDCFEVFTEKPGLKDAIIKMYSNYKHQYTAKEMIGITPFGTISFISKPYSGRSSDKYITENCGFADKLEKDDIVLADRGFTIKKVVEDKGASLRIPDAANRRHQLSSSAVERTRALASARNEVERVIGGLRQKCEVLSKRLPITTLNHEHNGENVLNMIVTVCSALYNLCPSIIL